MSLIDLRIARRGARQERKQGAGNGVFYHFSLRREAFANLGVGGSAKNQSEGNGNNGRKAFHIIIRKACLCLVAAFLAK